MSNHYKVWATGKDPNRRPDKGKKKPVAQRNARKARSLFLAKLARGSVAA